MFCLTTYIMLEIVGKIFITGIHGAAGSTAGDFHTSGKYHFFNIDESLYSKYLCFRAKYLTCK